MASFEEYYKKWKEKNNITTETPYQNLTDNQKKEEAVKNFEEKYNNISTWNQVQNIANNNLNKFNQKQTMERYINAKKISMQTVSNQIQENAKRQKEAEEQTRALLEQAEEKFRKQNPATVNMNQTEKDYDFKYLIPNQNITNKNDLKVLDSEELLQLTNGAIDQRNGIQKAIDSVSGIGGNILMGVESVIPSVSNYINKAGEVATEKAGKYLSKELLGTDDEASKLLGEQVFGKLWETTEISKRDKELNSEELKKWRKETINKNVTKTYLGKEIAKVAPSVGQNIIPMAISYFNPMAGSALFMTSAAGSYLDDAEERGMNKEQSLAYATVMGGLEGVTEKVITGEMASNAMKLFRGVGLSKETLKGYGVTTAENFFQEALMEPLQETTASLVGGKDKANWANIEKRMIESGASGILSSILLNGASTGIVSASNVLNKNNPSEIEIQTALADTINSKKVNIKNIIEGAKEAIKNKLNEDVINDTNQQTTQINNTQNVTQEQTPLTQNVQQQNSTDQINLNNIQSEQQTNGNMSNLMQSAQNEQINVQKYQYEKSDNVKIDNLRQDANRFFDNSEQAHNYINMLEQIVQDKDVDIRFDNTLTDENGNMVNGRYKDGIITINPNSTRAGEFIAIHELTHAIGTKDMINIVENYRNSNAEFDTAVKDLLKSYNQTEITEEALADVSAQLFGNQEFINNLSQTNPSVFKKIYNEIKYLWHQFRGYKNQNQFIEDLQYKWEQAYRSNNELNNGTNYSIQTDNNGNRYVKVDTDQDVFEGINEKDYNKIAKMYIQDYLLGKTTLANNDTAIIDSKSANKYTNPRQRTSYMKEKMQLTPELKNVLEIAKKESISLPIKENSKYKSWEYYTFNFELGNKNFEATVNIGIDKNGNRHFYEINKIHSTGISSVSTNSQHREDSINNSILPTQENVNSNTQKYSMQENNKYSKQNENWQEYLDNNFKAEGTRTNLQDINLPTKEKIQKSNKTLNLPTKENIQSNTTQEASNIPTKKTLNPTEISNLTEQDASTTPELPTKNYKKGNKESSFYSNITEDSKFLNEDLRDEMSKEENIKYYQGITNKETLEKAYTQLEDGGQQETLNWFTKEGKNVDATDVAKGWILLKQYQDSGDYQSAIEVAKKMREMGTKAGQAIQAYNILSRLTPEGMFYYAQSELTEAYNKMVEGKSQKWIEQNKDKFELTPTETQFIKDTMQEVSQMEEGYDKKVKLAEIQKMLTDKIPPTAGQSIKAWMRISMLFNPKTQVRNVLGNAVILPVNSTSDFISSGVDKLISKKTGIRTTGNMNLKNYGKGFGKGLYESYNDFRKGINTRDIEGNRFEISEGKSFKNKGIGKALNRVDNILSFMLDAGDRGFYEATFTNSINNQLTLNNTTEVTQDMIDIATNEALQRTWQDNNAYTESVLKIRNILNKANIKGYGLGDVIIPFAKTPANLTKAIVDYSPIGLTKAITADAVKFKNSLSNGQYAPQMQHKLVQNIGKGMAGTFLYVLGYGLAKAGIATGESDDDKDVKNFMKNSLGISSYSLKIGDKTFSYDWAQPVATPLAIMTNYFKYSEENPDTNIIEKGIKSLNIGTEQLLQQSFMESLNTILNGNGTTLENLSQAVLELPSRAIPTFSKQIADMVDGTQRTSFEYDKPVKSAINSVKAKIPGLSKSLPVSVDTLGNEIKKYGGDNNWFNVLLNPANVNKGQLSKSGEEIYRLYKQTGSTTVFPITAPYYVNNNGEKITMTAEERSKYQKVSGQYTEKVIKDLLSNNDYKKLSDSKKVELIEDIISDSNAKAKYDVLKIESKDAKKRRELIEKVQPKYYYDYSFKTKDIEGEDTTKRKNEVILNANYPNKIKGVLYQNTTGKQDDLYNNILSKDDIDINEYLNYKLQEFESDKEDDGTLSGKSVSGSKKKKVYNYVNNMNISLQQKMAILGTQYKLNRNEQKELYSYINNIPSQTKDEKLEIFKKYSSNFTIYKDGTLSFK